MPPSKPDIHPAWIGVALSFYAFIAIGIAEGGLGVLLPSIMTTFDLSSATVTLLFLSQFTGYIVAALASSLLSSRLGMAQMLLLAAAMLTIALLIYATVPLWGLMVAAGTLLGLGIGLIDAGINTYIASSSRAHLLGVLHGFYGIGALLGPAIAATLLDLQFNWRLVYLIFAIAVGLLVLGMGWAVVSRYAPLAKSVTIENTSAWRTLRTAFKTSAVLMSGLLLLIYVGIEVSIGNWAYSVQTISRNTPELLAGYSISAYWFGLTIGRLAMSRFVNRFGAIRLLDISMLLLLVGLLSWWLLPRQLISLPVMGFALAAIFPTTILLMPQRVPKELVPAAIGFLTSVGSVGSTTIPTLVGWVAAESGLGTVPGLLILPSSLMLLIHRWLVRSMPLRRSNVEP